jgi:transcription initiation factor TFIID subunit TAF12
MADNQKQYEELRKKYGLPDYNELEQELEISDIESKQLLRHIVMKIADRLDFYTGFLDQTLQPDGSSLHSMHEAKFLDEHSRKKMYSLYMRLMQMNRSLMEISLKRSEKDDADFIRSFFSEWKSIKAELLAFVKMVRDSWKSEGESDDYVGYVG